MLSAPFAGALFLTGPTGSGKSRLGVELAERLGAEIISMDSMAVYRGMDIGTAKPSPAERRRVPHHLLDVLDPWQSASVAWWLTRAEACARDIAARGKRILFVGGTAMYLKALLRGLFPGPSQQPALRRRLELEAQSIGAAALHERLAQVDPAAARRIHPHDLRRIVRALEVWELTGKPISAWQTQWGQQSGVRRQESGVRSQASARQHEAEVKGHKSEVGNLGLNSGPDAPAPDPCPLPPDCCLWLDVPRPELYERIDQRVEVMFAGGLIDEAQALRSLPHALSREATQALGYKEVFAFLDGQRTRPETIALVQTRSRQYAKRQITWFRHLPECRPASPQLTWTLWGDKMM